MRIPSLREVMRTDGPSKQADSKTTTPVSSVISEFSPPITPASATAFLSSEMTSILSSSVWSLPSSDLNASFARAWRTVMALPSRQA